MSSPASHETNQINRTLEYRLLDELNAELGSSYTLSDQEVLVCHTKDFTEGMTLQIDGSDFTVVTLPESDALNTYLTQTGASSNPIFFFRDKDTLMRARQMDESATLSYVLWFDYDIEAVNAGLFQQNLYDHLNRSEGNFGTRFKERSPHRLLQYVWQPALCGTVLRGPLPHHHRTDHLL